MDNFTAQGTRDILILLVFWLVMIVINLVKPKRK
jgi:hypothetical protein